MNYKMTELEAVNTMLQTIGEARVNEVSENTESDIALNILRQISRKIQDQGWSFNTEIDYEYNIDENGFLYIPENILRIDIEETEFIVQRGNRLYDIENQTFVFDDNQTADSVVMLDFEDLPNVAKEYVLAKSNFEFQKQTMGNTKLLQFARLEVENTFNELKRYELDMGDYNLYNNI